MFKFKGKIYRGIRETVDWEGSMALGGPGKGEGEGGGHGGIDDGGGEHEEAAGAQDRDHREGDGRRGGIPAHGEACWGGGIRGGEGVMSNDLI